MDCAFVDPSKPQNLRNNVRFLLFNAEGQPCDRQSEELQYPQRRVVFLLLVETVASSTFSKYLLVLAGVYGDPGTLLAIERGLHSKIF